MTDQIGSVRKIADQNGNVCYDADYTPYGQQIYVASNSCPAQPYLFAGMERDDNVFDYDFARYYSSRLGRFMSADPLGGSVDDPQSLNRYTYVLNDPINLDDPSGMKLPVCDFVHLSMYRVGCPWSYGVYWFNWSIWGTPYWGEGSYPYNTVTISDWGYTGGNGSAANNGTSQTPCSSAGNAPSPRQYQAMGYVAQASWLFGPGVGGRRNRH